MSKKSINETLFDEAKTAAGRLCFDVSVDKKTCISKAQLLIAEIRKMVTALETATSITIGGKEVTK